MQLTIAFVVILASLKSLDCQNQKRIKPMNARLNYFDTDLLRYAAEDGPGNVLMSPASIKSVLAMLLEGAGGETANELRSALRLIPNKNDYRDQLNKYLTSLKYNTTTTQLTNANAVFVSSAVTVKDEYETLLKRVYLSEIFRMDFRDPAITAGNINSWVNLKTRGLIPAILEPGQVNPSTNIMILNALYFKSSWVHAFSPPQRPNGDCFYNRGECKSVSMMKLKAELNYAFVDNLRAHAVELPYEGGRYSMVLLVPQEQDGIGILIRDLPYMSLPQISLLMQPNEVELSMPKFKVDYTEDLSSVLKQMKVVQLFSANADLSGIIKGPSQINALFHKVYLDVNEKGTIAAAVTGAVVVPLISAGIPVTVDRPFIFFIRDNSLGVVLFEGKIEDPSGYEDGVQSSFNGVYAASEFGYQTAAAARPSLWQGLVIIAASLLLFLSN